MVRLLTVIITPNQAAEIVNGVMAYLEAAHDREINLQLFHVQLLQHMLAQRHRTALDLLGSLRNLGRDARWETELRKDVGLAQLQIVAEDERQLRAERFQLSRETTNAEAAQDTKARLSDLDRELALLKEQRRRQLGSLEKLSEPNVDADRWRDKIEVERAGIQELAAEMGRQEILMKFPRRVSVHCRAAP